MSTRFVNHTTREILVQIDKELWKQYKNKNIAENFSEVHYTKLDEE